LQIGFDGNCSSNVMARLAILVKLIRGSSKFGVEVLEMTIPEGLHG